MKKIDIRILLFCLFLMGTTLHAQDQLLIPFGSTWKYLDNGSDQGKLWRSASFNDASWSSGKAELGYGDGDEKTVISYGSDKNNKHITSYFRHRFNIVDVSVYKNFLLKLIKDDAALVYVNGQEVMRSNFGTGNYTYNDLAYSSTSGSEEKVVWEEFVPSSFFKTGANVIAVEVHQYNASSSDLSFDLELLGLDSSVSLYRSPYIQMTSPHSAIIKWKTDVATSSRVKYGTSLGNLTNTAISKTPTVNHELSITGLKANLKYYYSVGNFAQDFNIPDKTYFFKTNPVVGTDYPTRIWVIGDAGTGKPGQFDVRDAYLNYADTTKKADLWLMLGDNAYTHGREADYQMGLFNVYGAILKNTASFPTSGNHDFYGEASPMTENGPYYDIFALPKNGECGGVSSGTESYYSFDYGNIHFVSLESYELDRDSTAAMATWLKKDLAKTTAKWLIAYWHYPPYTKVGHDSDDPNNSNGRSTEMRKYFNPILESFGVDLVLSGHSHAYERSFLLNGHYGLSNSLTSSMILNAKSGDVNQGGAYEKPKQLAPNSGTVYLVCGNSGKVFNSSKTHPAMFTTHTDVLGSVVIDIDGDSLSCKFLTEDGIVQDEFNITKTLPMSQKSVETPRSYKIFPNPTSDFIKISWNDPIRQGVVQIFSVNGQLVKTFKIEHAQNNDMEHILNVSDLEQGVYILKIKMADELMKSEPLLIQR